MKIIDKYKEWDKKLESKTISSKYQGYFNKWIFRFAMLLILIVFLVDFTMNDYNLVSFDMSCTNQAGCNNPFYVCTQEDLNFYSTHLNSQKLCRDKEITALSKIEINGTKLANVQRLPYNFHIGRDDFIHNHGYDIIVFIFVSAFMVNALWYKKKYNSWKYLGKEYHTQQTKVKNDNI